MKKLESAHRRPPRAALRGAGSTPLRTDVRSDRQAASLAGVLRNGFRTMGLQASASGYLKPVEAASWAALYAFAFRLIVSVHLSAMPGAQLADLAASGGGLFAAVWSCHEFGGKSSKAPVDPAKRGAPGEACTFCAAVAGSAAAMPDGLVLLKPQYTSFSLSPAVSSNRPAGSEYFHARPRGPPAQFA
jgi:hypothetical protein